MAKQPNTYIALSGLVFQMAIVIAGFSWLGTYLDGDSDKALFTILLSLLGVGIALYLAIKQVMDISKK